VSYGAALGREAFDPVPGCRQTRVILRIWSRNNLAATATIDDIREIYLGAWKAKVKGITVYRYGSREGQVLTFAVPEPGVPHADTELSGGCAGHACEF